MVLEWGVPEDKWEGRTEDREWGAQEDPQEWADLDREWVDRLAWAAHPALAARGDHPWEWVPVAREDHNDLVDHPAAWDRRDLAAHQVAAGVCGARGRSLRRGRWARAARPPT